MNRRHSSSSYVSIDHFDPEGMQQLQRTLSNKKEGDPSASSSDFTLNGYEIGDGPFDLAKFLRGLMKQ